MYIVEIMSSISPKYLRYDGGFAPAIDESVAHFEYFYEAENFAFSKHLGDFKISRVTHLSFDELDTGLGNSGGSA